MFPAEMLPVRLSVRQNVRAVNKGRRRKPLLLGRMHGSGRSAVQLLLRRGMTGCVWLKFLVFSHPLGPGARLYSTRQGPPAGNVERAMPLELVQLLKIHLSSRPV